MYTKQHIEEIAELIANIDDYQERVRTAERFASKFGRDNRRFYEPYFMHACKVRFVNKQTCAEGLSEHDLVERTNGECYYIDIKTRLCECCDEYGTREFHKRLNPVRSYYWSRDFCLDIELKHEKFLGEIA